MEVVKGHQASFPLLPKEGLLCDRLLVSCWPNENILLHHGLVFCRQNTVTSDSVGECLHTHYHERKRYFFSIVMETVGHQGGPPV